MEVGVDVSQLKLAKPNKFTDNTKMEAGFKIALDRIARSDTANEREIMRA